MEISQSQKDFRMIFGQLRWLSMLYQKLRSLCRRVNHLLEPKRSILFTEFKKVLLCLIRIHLIQQLFDQLVKLYLWPKLQHQMHLCLTCSNPKNSIFQVYFERKRVKNNPICLMLQMTIFSSDFGRRFGFIFPASSRKLFEKN